MVDGCAFWIGSQNLYPFWLSDYSFMIEDARAVATFTRSWAEPLWKYSSAGGHLPQARCRSHPRFAG